MFSGKIWENKSQNHLYDVSMSTPARSEASGKASSKASSKASGKSSGKASGNTELINSGHRIITLITKKSPFLEIQKAVCLKI